MPKALAEMTLEELWQRFPIELVPPRPEWPVMYADESAGLKNRLPADWIVRMEHIGSTAVGTIWAKPIVDILVETTGEADWVVRRHDIRTRGRSGKGQYNFKARPAGESRTHRLDLRRQRHALRHDPAAADKAGTVRRSEKATMTRKEPPWRRQLTRTVCLRPK